MVYRQYLSKSNRIKSLRGRPCPAGPRFSFENFHRSVPQAFRVQCQRMADMPTIVLTIAGFDPSSGAGVTADIKTIAAHGCYGVACITAMTVQSTAGVRRVDPCDPGLVADTLEELASDIKIDAVHIGMLGSGRVAKSVAGFLGRKKLSSVVLDPILKSSFGTDLLD